ncbi:MAG: carbohydrate porin, partial [Methyloceanibacter sp.]
MLEPVAASANCEVPTEAHGLPEDAIGKLDIGNSRAGLSRMGIGTGGAYYAEPFYNLGGEDEGGEYQGVLELYVNADMQKLGLWDGL